MSYFYVGIQRLRFKPWLGPALKPLRPRNPSSQRFVTYNSYGRRLFADRCPGHATKSHRSCGDAVVFSQINLAACLDALETRSCSDHSLS